jgi:hypothetical protein
MAIKSLNFQETTQLTLIHALHQILSKLTIQLLLISEPRLAYQA